MNGLFFCKKENMLTLEDIIPDRCKNQNYNNDFLDLVPLEESVKHDSDYFILERLKIISLKSKWDINEATIAVKEACIQEWYRRYGNNAPIPDIQLSEEALAQLAAEKEDWL